MGNLASHPAGQAMSHFPSLLLLLTFLTWLTLSLLPEFVSLDSHPLRLYSNLTSSGKPSLTSQAGLVASTGFPQPRLPCPWVIIRLRVQLGAGPEEEFREYRGLPEIPAFSPLSQGQPSSSVPRGCPGPGPPASGPPPLSPGRVLLDELQRLPDCFYLPW